MNRLLVGTIVLSVMGAPLAFAQPDAAAQAPQSPQAQQAPRAPQSTNQVGPYNQDRAGQPGIPNAQGQTNAPYPYGARSAAAQGYQSTAPNPGAADDRTRGYQSRDYRQGADQRRGYNAGVARRGVHRHRLRVCKWRGHHRVCFWR